jgi:heterodisulfide reductase subunit B
MQFDRVQNMMTSDDPKGSRHLASIVYPQLLGLGMGISGEELGISENELDISNIESFLEQE